MEEYFEINSNNQNIKCKLYLRDGMTIKKVVLFVHGFGDHKDNCAAKKFSDNILRKYEEAAVLTFNLPCHDDDEKKKIAMIDCMSYLGTVVEYIKAEFQTNQIYLYATSFGGYLVLKYVSEFGNPFKKIALRCPAVNMSNVLMNTIMNQTELEKVLSGKSIPVGFDRKVIVNQKFLLDLQEAAIQNRNYSNYADKILIIHGTKDEVASFEDSKLFAKSNSIEFIPVENADYRFLNPAHMEYATRIVLKFFHF